MCIRDRPRPTDPTREGYTFVRWNLGANAYNFSTPVNSNITLTAVWEEVTKMCIRDRS